MSVSAEPEIAPIETIDAMLAAGPNAPIEDPYALYARARRETPVLTRSEAGSSSYLVTRYDDVRLALRDHERFSNASNGDRGIAIVIGRTIVGMDGAEHLRHRALITPAVAPRALRGDFPAMVQGIAEELVDRFVGEGRADLVREFAFLYPIRVFVEPLGLPPSDIEQFHAWSIDLTRVAHDPGRGLAASAAIRAYLQPIIAAKRAAPGDDIISTLVTSEVEDDEQGGAAHLSDEQIANFICLLIMAGAETTYHLLGSALYALLSHPEALDEVCAHPDRIPLAIDETLRWESPVQIVTREVRENVELSGVTLERGRDVVLAIGSANRDESRFPEPDRFDLHRFDACAGGDAAAEHIAFGFGRHYCAGSRLALLEAETALRTLLARLPDLRFDPDAARAKMAGWAFRSPDALPVRFG